MVGEGWGMWDVCVLMAGQFGHRVYSDHDAGLI